MKASSKRQLTADLLLLLVTLIWGSTFVMVKVAATGYSVFPFLAMRFGLASLALLPLAWRHLRGLGVRGIGAGTLIGTFLFAGYAFQTAGLLYTSASKAGFITGLSVVMVPAISCLVLRRLPGPDATVGVLLATIGLGLLTLDQRVRVAKGDALVLMCALSFAAHIVSVSAFAPRRNPMALAFVQVITVAIVSAIVAMMSPAGWPRPTAQTWFAAGFTGVLATAVAFGLQTSMQRFTTPTHTALIFTGEPLFAALFGVLLAGDVLTARIVVGGLLILAGTVTSEINWSRETARIVSRFLAPQYIAPILQLALALADPRPWPWAVSWALALLAVSVGLPLLLMLHGIRSGRVSDWHISNRAERLKPMTIVTGLLATGVPLALLILFRGPSTLTLAFAAAFGLTLFNVIVTFWWKISQHVSTIAASAIVATGILGIWAAPSLLLVPLVAWARVRVGAHTVLQTIAGGAAGFTFGLGALLLFGGQ